MESLSGDERGDEPQQQQDNGSSLEEYLSDWEPQLNSPSGSLSHASVGPQSTPSPKPHARSKTPSRRRRHSSSTASKTGEPPATTTTTAARILAENLLAKTQTATKILKIVWTQHQQRLIAKFEEELEAMRRTHAMTLRYTGQQLRAVLKTQQKREEKDFIAQHELDMEILRKAKEHSIKNVRAKSKHALDVYNHAEALAALHITPSTPMLPFAATSALDRTVTSILCASASIETEIQFAKNADISRVSDLVRRSGSEDTKLLASSPSSLLKQRPQSSQRRRPLSAVRRAEPVASLDRTASSDTFSTTPSRLKCSHCHGFIPLRQKKIRVPLKEGTLQVAESGVQLNCKQFCSWRCAKQWTLLSEGATNKTARPTTASKSSRSRGLAHTWS